MVNAVIDIARKLGAIDARTQNSAGHAESTQESAFDNTDILPSNERKINLIKSKVIKPPTKKIREGKEGEHYSSKQQLND